MDGSQSQDEVMTEWVGWFAQMGAAVKDMGSPFGPSTAVGADGVRDETSTGLGGYTILEATDLDHAATLVAGCPQFKAGGSIEIFEAMPM